MAEKTFTKDELKQFDGKNGHPAYVAVEGVVYDVTNSPAWKNGEHHGNLAGNDLTDALLNQSPHGKSKLAKLPVVGKLV
ncbi:MAG TPA: cytochrome B5 [Candidatus Ligilactobacillus excrementigallinarum]|uniref:Cytochrome B5 n=1 Tax=Candidatus Ligilactobacillus excrementigallinarum TaxID=2838641 RepID=A0A9D1UXZ9_9LACO|nr:cytochrome B5 [Candidatus Ligilactobacillus excrementigallinarum]